MVFRWCEGGKIAILLKNILAVSIMFVYLQRDLLIMRVEQIAQNKLNYKKIKDN